MRIDKETFYLNIGSGIVSVRTLWAGFVIYKSVKEDAMLNNIAKGFKGVHVWTVFGYTIYLRLTKVDSIKVPTICVILRTPSLPSSTN